MGKVEDRIKEYKEHKWFACEMDSGVIASADTLRELLVKFERKSAQYLGYGEYQFKEIYDQVATTITIYKDVESAKRNGWDIHDDENNTWDVNLVHDRVFDESRKL